MTTKDKLEKLYKYVLAKEGNAIGVIRAIRKKKPLDVGMLGGWAIERMAFTDIRKKLKKILNEVPCVKEEVCEHEFTLLEFSNDKVYNCVKCGIEKPAN